MRMLIATLLLIATCSPAFAIRPFNTEGTDGASALIPPLPDCVNNYALTANTPVTVTWPTACGSPSGAANSAVISASALIWIGAAGHTAAVPATTITDGTGSNLSLGQFVRYGDTTFSIISATDQEISISFWK